MRRDHLVVLLYLTGFVETNPMRKAIVKHDEHYMAARYDYSRSIDRACL